MPFIQLRLHAGTTSPGDLTLSVQEKTYTYLMSSYASEIRVSAYLDRDWPQVEEMYAEIFVSENCAFDSKVKEIIAGSKTRSPVELPGPMEEGEQLVVVVKRTSLAKSSK
jgi:hypothetical protein